MTSLIQGPRHVVCATCGTAQTWDYLVSREIEVLQREVTQMRALLDHLKPHFITAAYYLDQHAEMLSRQQPAPADDAVLTQAREAQSRALSAHLMDAYCRTVEALALR